MEINPLSLPSDGTQARQRPHGGPRLGTYMGKITSDQLAHGNIFVLVHLEVENLQTKCREGISKIKHKQL